MQCGTKNRKNDRVRCMHLLCLVCIALLPLHQCSAILATSATLILAVSLVTPATGVLILPRHREVVHVPGATLVPVLPILLPVLPFFTGATCSSDVFPKSLTNYQNYRGYYALLV